MIDSTTVARTYDKPSLIKLYEELIVIKMRLDKFFSDFLEDNPLDHDELDNPAWVIYKSKMKEYRNTTLLINKVQYKMSKI